MELRGIDAVTYSDELPDESELPEIPDVALHRVSSETCGVPVERWAQVVGEPLAWVDSVDTLSELLGLGIDRLLRLHPQQVSIRRECDRSVDRTEGSSLVAVVTLSGPGRVPVPVRWVCKTELGLGDNESIGVGEVSNAIQELRLAEGAVLRLDGFCEDIGEGCESGGLDPFVLDHLEGVSSLACLVGFQHDGDKGPQGGVCRTEDESVVALIDIGCN